MVKNDIETAEEFLKNHSLSYEIIFFSGEIMKNSGLDYEKNLIKLINTTKNLKGTEKFKTGLLGGNAVNLLY
jgi:hypothetical protein